MSASLTITGRLGADPELRFTQAGKAVASLNVVTDRRIKTEAGDWESRDTTWWRVSCWEQLAENVTEHLKKGDAVIVVGRAYMNEYEKDGETRKSLDMQAYHVGKDEKYVKRGERQQGQAEDAWTTGSAPF